MTKYVSKPTDKFGRVHYTKTEHAIWKALFTRQKAIIQGRACQAFLDGIKTLRLSADKIPQCNEVSATLQQSTGWSVKPVKAIIPVSEFFELIAHRQFPIATFIRHPDDLDYLQEPDVFHEFFGHCPLLTHQAYADFIEWYGQCALKGDAKTRQLMGRLFWFTIEFGLIKNTDGFEIYGGGILSSKEETIFSVESPLPERLPFDLKMILNNEYRYDRIQSRYYYLNNLEELYQLTKVDLLKVALALVRK